MIGTRTTGRHRARPSRPRRRGKRGFALLLVIILTTLVSAAVAVTLEESVDNIRSAGLARSRELLSAGVEHGLNLGVLEASRLDPARIAEGSVAWDIFERDRLAPAGTDDWIGPLAYPPEGEHQGLYRVRLGLRPAQRTRAPAGEDVRSAHGQVLEVQVGVDTSPDRPSMVPAEERVSVGVLIPRRASHAN